MCFFFRCSLSVRVYQSKKIDILKQNQRESKKERSKEVAFGTNLL